MSHEATALSHEPPLSTMALGVAVAAATGFWAVVLILAWLNPFCSLDFKQQGADRIVGTIHAIANGGLAMRVFLFTSPQCDVSEFWIYAPLVFFQGFLIVDLVSMTVCDIWKGWRRVDKPILLHHVMLLFATWFAFVMDVGLWFQCTILINELSTPLLHIFWYLQHTGQKESVAFLVNGAAFTLVFFLCRICFLPFSFYQFVALDFCRQSETDAYRYVWPVICGGYVSLYILNVIWFRKLVLGAWNTLQKSKARSKKAGGDPLLIK